MKHSRKLIAAGILVGAAALIGADRAPSDDGPRFNAKGELLFPANYREWVSSVRGWE